MGEDGEHPPPQAENISTIEVGSDENGNVKGEWLGILTSDSEFSVNEVLFAVFWYLELNDSGIPKALFWRLKQSENLKT